MVSIYATVRKHLSCAGDRIYFKDATRAARNLPDINRIDELRRSGIVIVFYALGITLDENTHPSIVMSYLVQGVIGKHETDNLGWRIQEGQQKKLSWRVKPGHGAWGYLYNRQKKLYEIDPRSEYDLRYIFDNFDSSNYTLPEFVAHLNDIGLKNQSGKAWTKGNIYKLLTERHEYHGEFIWRGKVYSSHYDADGQNVHPLALEPQIYYDKARWLARKKRIATQAVGLKKNRRQAHFTRLIRCAHCEDDRNLFTADHQKGKSGRGSYVYYKHRCAHEIRPRYISEPRLIEAIDGAVATLQFTGAYAERLGRLFEGAMTQQASNFKSDQKYIRLKCESLDQQIRRLYREYAASEPAAARQIMETIREMQDEIKTLEKKGQSLRAEDFEINNTILRYIEELRTIPEKYLAARTTAEKAKLLRNMVRAIYVDGDEVIFDWQEPYAFLADEGIYLALTKPRGGWKSGGKLAAQRAAASLPPHTPQMSGCSIPFTSAERVGFEPTVPKGHNAFRVRPDRPLRHLSRVSPHPGTRRNNHLPKYATGANRKTAVRMRL